MCKKQATKYVGESIIVREDAQELGSAPWLGKNRLPIHAWGIQRFSVVAADPCVKSHRLLTVKEHPSAWYYQSLFYLSCDRLMSKMQIGAKTAHACVLFMPPLLVTLPHRPAHCMAGKALAFTSAMDVLVKKFPTQDNGVAFIFQGSYYLAAPWPIRSAKKALACYEKAVKVSKLSSRRRYRHYVRTIQQQSAAVFLLPYPVFVISLCPLPRKNAARRWCLFRRRTNTPSLLSVLHTHGPPPMTVKTCNNRVPTPSDPPRFPRGR